jgi:N4-gp56 family major capsid protein
MAVTTRSNIGSNYLQTYLYKNVLENFEPSLRFYDLGEKPMVDDGFGTVAWAKPSKLTVTPAGATLTEGTVPTSTSFSYSVISATPVQYGLFVELSDRLLGAAPTRILENAGTELANNLGRIVDQVIQTEVMAGTNVIYGGNATSRASVDAADTIRATDLRRAQIKLRSVNAPDFGGYYVAIMHPLVAGDLRAETNGEYVEFAKYATPDRLFAGEVGAIHGVRVVESSNVQSFSSTVSVYPTLVVGRGAYGVTEWNSLEAVYKPLGSGEDPLNQKATIGVKIDFAAKRLQEDALVRIESAATAV